MACVLVSVDWKALTLTLAHDDGTDDTVQAVEPDATITINGYPSKLADLCPGDDVECYGDPANTVIATR